jgi:hypothetical protein
MTQQILVRENMKRGRAMLTPTALSFEQSVVLAALHNHSCLIDRYTERAPRPDLNRVDRIR